MKYAFVDKNRLRTACRSVEALAGDLAKPAGFTLRAITLILRISDQRTNRSANDEESRV